MKKTLFFTLLSGGILLAAILFAALSFSSADKSMSLLSMNAQALSQTEGSCSGGTCSVTFPNGDTCKSCCPADQIPYCNMYAAIAYKISRIAPDPPGFPNRAAYFFRDTMAASLKEFVSS